MTWPFYPHDYAAGEISPVERVSLSLSLFLCGICDRSLFSSDDAVRDFSTDAITTTEILIGLTWSIYWVAGPLYWVRAIDWLYVSQHGAGSTRPWHSSVQMKWLICYKHTGFTFLVSTHFGIFSDSLWTRLQLCGRTVTKRVDLKLFSTTVPFWCQEFLDACSCIACKFSC